MLALLYLILAFLLGDSICKRFFPFVSTPHRVAASFLAGLLISTWITYLAAAFFGDTTYPMLAGNMIFAVIAIATLYLLEMRFPAKPAETAIPEETARFVRADWITVSVFFVVAVVMAYSTFTMSDGNMKIANHQSSDFGSTASIMQSFAVGHNFPTEYPHFTGERIRYHFFFYFQAGNLEYLGLSPATSNNTLSILTLLSMLVLVMTLGAVLFRSRAAGRIGAILFYFHGSLSFIPFYKAQGSISAVWEKLQKMNDFLPSGFQYRGEDWGVWSQVVYLNQRHLASSIGLFLIVVVFLAIRHRERVDLAAARAERAKPIAEPPVEKSEAAEDSSDTEIEKLEAASTEVSDDPAAVAEPKGDIPTETLVDAPPGEASIEPASQPNWPTRLAPFILSGVILGLMPMWNGAVFAGAAGVLAVMFVLLPYRREMLALAASSVMFSLPQVIFLKTGLSQPAGYSLFYFGYTLSDPTIGKMLYYLAFTFGFKWVFIALAIALSRGWQRKFMIAFTALVIMATCFQFSEEVLANHKFFNVWLVLMNVPVGYGIVRLWNLLPPPAVWAPRIATVILMFGIMIGGIFDLFPVKNSFWVEYKFQGDPLVEWIRANTDPKSIFLSHRYVNHGILVAGRRLFYGHPYYAWGAGYNVGERDGVYRKMLESKDINEVFTLIRSNKIDYVAIDNIIRNGADFIKNNNEQLFQAHFPVVYSDTENKYDGLKIYSVPRDLPQSVANAAPVSTSNSTAQTTPNQTSGVANAFTGGEGSGGGQFSRPRGVAVDTKGSIYVADTGNARVQKFSADGTFVTSIGKNGGAEGEIKEPNGVAVDDAGNIYVTDAANHKLVKYSANGTFVKEWKGPDPGFYGPRDIELSPDKKLYIVDQGRTRIVRFDPATEAFTSFGSSGSGEGQFNESTGIAIGGGNIFVADAGNNRIQVFDMDGKFIRLWEVPAWERYVWHYPDLVFDAKGDRLYVSNGWKREILIYSRDGRLLGPEIKATANGELHNPSGIVMHQAGGKRRLLILNTDSRKISEVSVD